MPSVQTVTIIDGEEIDHNENILNELEDNEVYTHYATTACKLSRCPLLTEWLHEQGIEPTEWFIMIGT